MANQTDESARVVLRAAIDAFVDRFLELTAKEDVEHLQLKVASLSTLLLFEDRTGIVARIGVVFGPHLTDEEVGSCGWQVEDLQITSMGGAIDPTR